MSVRACACARACTCMCSVFRSTSSLSFVSPAACVRVPACMSSCPRVRVRVRVRVPACALSSGRRPPCPSCRLLRACTCVHVFMSACACARACTCMCVVFRSTSSLSFVSPAAPPSDSRTRLILRAYWFASNTSRLCLSTISLSAGINCQHNRLNCQHNRLNCQQAQLSTQQAQLSTQRCQQSTQTLLNITIFRIGCV